MNNLFTGALVGLVLFLIGKSVMAKPVMENELLEELDLSDIPPKLDSNLRPIKSPIRPVDMATTQPIRVPFDFGGVPVPGE